MKDVRLKSDTIILRPSGDGSGMSVMIVDTEYFSLTKLLRSAKVNNNVLMIIGVHQSMSKGRIMPATRITSDVVWGLSQARKNILLPPLMSVS
jgi:hypothetical protein